MSWSYDTVEAWVSTALTNLGYSQAQAELAAKSVTWLQQRHAPGVAAVAQHIDFISAYKLTPAQGGDKEAHCPIVLSESQLSNTNIPTQTFHNVRQPLLLLPTLARTGGLVQWNDFETHLSQGALNIEYERKTLRKVLVTDADVQWTPANSNDAKNTEITTEISSALSDSNTPDAPSNRHEPLATEVLSRELVYVKTVQHYAGALPPREPLDSLDDSDNTSSAS